uniref:Uncharacterized protein n=1 Tax=Trichobilharzia regenti TaxID=157069 RepID=A0AA85JR95_TRIRE|nr:unnamed protein product [Trichobilharzia regenti]
MEEPSDLPGYFYDQTKKRYFKIEKHETHDSLTKRVVDTFFSTSEIQRKINVMLSRHGEKNQNILRMLSHRETSTSPSPNASYDWSHCYMRNKECRQVIPIRGPIRNALVCPNHNLLCSLNSDSVRIFSFKWCIDESSIENQPRFELYGIKTIVPENIGCLRFLDFCWYVPGRKIILFVESGLRVVLITFDVSDGSYSLTPELTTPSSCSLFRFTSPYLVPENSAYNKLHDPHSLTILTRNQIYISDCLDCSPLYVCNPMGQSVRNRRNRLMFTACCEASFWKSFDSVQKCIDSVNGRQPLLYVAGVLNEKGFLSLVEPSLTPHKSVQLINFQTGYWNTFAQRIPTNANMEISSLQCLGTYSGDRLGLIVGRRCGLIELWDERFPNKSVIEYYGSNGTTFMSLSSHIPPFPVIDPVLQKTMACSLLPNHHIGIWNLQTGKVIDVQRLSHPISHAVSCSPPVLIHRTSWSDKSGIVYNDPAILALDSSSIYSFDW